jgi:transposase
LNKYIKKLDNNLIQRLTDAGIEMTNFVNAYFNHPINLDNLLRHRNDFNTILKKFPYKDNDMNVREAFNLEEHDGEDGFLRYDEDTIQNAINNLNDDENIIYTLVKQLLFELNAYNRVMAARDFDGDEPLSAYHRYIDMALKNIVAVYNIAGERVAAGGSKKSRKSHKKSRKSHKKSRKSHKKSRKSHKKSRKSAKKSRKH